jgi:TPR repeat protein
VEAKAIFESPLLDNHPDALFMLGEIAMFGDLSTETAAEMATDPEVAFTYYARAAQMGHPMAQYKLAVAYASGIGAPKGAKDEALAVLYFYFASLSGNVHASLALGYRHHFGRECTDRPRPCTDITATYAVQTVSQYSWGAVTTLCFAYMILSSTAGS